MWDNPWFSLLWVILSVVVIIALAYWFTKYVVGRGAFNGLGMSGGGERFRVMARLNLGRDQMVLLVQAGERFFLLGVTAGAISNLAEYTREEAEAWTTAPEQPAPPSFGEALRTVLQQKRRR